MDPLWSKWSPFLHVICLVCSAWLPPWQENGSGAFTGVKSKAIERESDCEAVGECIIDEEHRTEDEEAIFRRVYDYLTKKKYSDGMSKDAKRAVRKKAQRYSCIVCTLYARKVKTSSTKMLMTKHSAKIVSPLEISYFKFNNSINQELTDLLGISHWLTTGYHPQVRFWSVLLW